MIGACENTFSTRYVKGSNFTLLYMCRRVYSTRSVPIFASRKACIDYMDLRIKSRPCGPSIGTSLAKVGRLGAVKNYFTQTDRHKSDVN